MVLRMTKKRGFILAEAAVASLVAGIFLAAASSSLSVSALLVKRYSERVALERLKREIMVELAAGNASAASAAGLSAGEGWRQIFISLEEIAGKLGKRGEAIAWPGNR